MPDNDTGTGREIIPWSPVVAGRDQETDAAASAARARRVLVACAVAVAAGVTGVMALIYPGHQPPPDPVAGGFVFPDLPEPSAAVSILPAPTSTSTSPTPAATEVAVRAPASKRPKRSTPPPSPSTSAPVVDLVVGATVGLEMSGRPGYRLRHRDFVGRVDRITSEQDRADSRFVVRKGLGRDGCVSLEAVNYPGYFLRHRYFVLRLEPAGRRENPQLFAADATFCPEPVADGTAFALEAVNYPGWALAVQPDGVVHLDQDDPTAFRVRPPL